VPRQYRTWRRIEPPTRATQSQRLRQPEAFDRTEHLRRSSCGTPDIRTTDDVEQRRERMIHAPDRHAPWTAHDERQGWLFCVSGA